MPKRTIGPGGYEFLPLADALQAYTTNREIHGVPEPEFPDGYWHKSWLPFMTQDAQRLFVDCDRVLLGGYSPVRLVTWQWDNYEVDRT